MKKNYFMNEALKQAKIAFEHDEVPVGAVLVEDNKVIASAFNQNLSLNDPTAHAEILVLRNAANIKNTPRLDGCDLYITLEPCLMCAAAAALARIRRIYYAVADAKFGAIESGAQIFHDSSCYHKPEIYSGISETEARKLVQKFFQLKRLLVI